MHLALFAEECASCGVTPVPFSLLSLLATQPGLDQAALAFAVGVDRATTANVVARLEKRGLLRRRPGPTDRRVKLVELTAAGTRLLARIDPHARRAHERTLDALPPREGRGSWYCCTGWSMPAMPTAVRQCCCEGRHENHHPRRLSRYGPNPAVLCAARRA
jgi:DNA-binding MarR family transcriptional regulator